MCKSENTGKEDIKGMAALGREGQGRKTLMQYFTKSVTQVTSLFLSPFLSFTHFIRNLFMYLQLSINFYMHQESLKSKISFLILPKKQNSR